MVAEFIRFYHYTAEQALNEYAVRFLALMNSMYQLKAEENIDELTNNAAATNGNGGELLKSYEKQASGLPGILREVRVIKP